MDSVTQQGESRRVEIGDVLIYVDGLGLAGPGFYAHYPNTATYVGYWRHNTCVMVLERLGKNTYLVLSAHGPRVVATASHWGRVKRHA